mmetsp:Transcript_2705/g.9096  ORF Transcript_2705/g.9096 Transcript_2705/m.9096 type:complete len:259 (-) Transcript_2705:497-1273(-)
MTYRYLRAKPCPAKAPRAATWAGASLEEEFWYLPTISPALAMARTSFVMRSCSTKARLLSSSRSRPNSEARSRRARKNGFGPLTAAVLTAARALSRALSVALSSRASAGGSKGSWAALLRQMTTPRSLPPALLRIPASVNKAATSFLVATFGILATMTVDLEPPNNERETASRPIFCRGSASLNSKTFFSDSSKDAPTTGTTTTFFPAKSFSLFPRALAKMSVVPLGCVEVTLVSTWNSFSGASLAYCTTSYTCSSGP